MTRHVIGILGAGFIGPAGIVQPAARRSDASTRAVASRDREKAQRFAATHGIPMAYGSYAELVADPEITLVYNALPPSEHARWSVAALEAGKHVLCEKPIAMNAKEASMIGSAAEAAGCQVVEAFHDRYHPLFSEILAITRSSEFGAVQEVIAEASIFMPFNETSFRFDPRLGGGALMEFGCYPVRWLRNIVGEEPSVLTASAKLNPLGGDAFLEASLAFPGGARGSLLIDTQPAVPGVTTRIEVRGSSGTLVVSNPITPHQGHGLHLTSPSAGDSWRTVGGVSSYDYQLTAVLTAIETGIPAITSRSDFVANMATIDSLYSAAGVERNS